MENTLKAVNTEDMAKKINAKIKETWTRLNDDDVKLYGTNQEQFFKKLEEKQNISRVDAEKHLKDIEKSCSCSESPNTDKPTSVRAA